MPFKQIFTIVLCLFISNLVFAKKEKKPKIEDRVVALEELTILQQAQIDQNTVDIAALSTDPACVAACNDSRTDARAQCDINWHLPNCQGDIDCEAAVEQAKQECKETADLDLRACVSSC